MLSSNFHGSVRDNSQQDKIRERMRGAWSSSSPFLHYDSSAPLQAFVTCLVMIWAGSTPCLVLDPLTHRLLFPSSTMTVHLLSLDPVGTCNCADSQECLSCPKVCINCECRWRHVELWPTHWMDMTVMGVLLLSCHACRASRAHSYARMLCTKMRDVLPSGTRCWLSQWEQKEPY